MAQCAESTPHWTVRGCPRDSEAWQLPSCRPAQMAYAATRCCGLRNDTRAECISVCKASTHEEQRPLVSYFPENDLKTGAENECLAHGLRLCSRRELRDGVCCKTGCNSDSRFAWTADACPRELCSKHCLASDNSTSVQGRLSTAAAAQLRATYAWLRREDGRKGPQPGFRFQNRSLQKLVRSRLSW